jgi:hypothetical protein
VGELIQLFGPEPMTAKRREHLRERVSQLALQIALLDSEKRHIEGLLEEADTTDPVA